MTGATSPEQRSGEEQLRLYRDADGCGIGGDPLLWRKQDEKAMPEIAQLAKSVLCVPASSAE